MPIGDGSISDGLSELWTENLDKFNAKEEIGSFIPFSTIFTGTMVAQMYYWGSNRSILQRVFETKSLANGQKGMILAGFEKFLIPIIVVLSEIIAFHIFDGSLDNADQAYPALVRKVLPSAFLGFFTAVLFGAVLSSFNSLLNSSSTLFGIDLYRQYFNNDASEIQTVKAGKKIGLFLAVISMSIPPFIANPPDGLFSYIQESLASLSVPILAVIVVGITLDTGRDELVKLAVEDLACQTKDVISAMKRDNNSKISTLKVDEGASAKNYLMQFQSDLLNVEVGRPKMIEVTALGTDLLLELKLVFGLNQM